MRDHLIHTRLESMHNNRWQVPTWIVYCFTLQNANYDEDKKNPDVWNPENPAFSLLPSGR